MYYTERTPYDSVELIRKRLADKNNRYRADQPTETNSVIYVIRLRRSSRRFPTLRIGQKSY